MTQIHSKRKAGRPRAFDREQALSIALDIFWRHGYEGTSVPQLTAAMGISPPSLYAAFGSKETLYREAVALYVSRYGNFMRHLQDESGSARATIERALQETAEQFAANDHPPGCMISSAELHVSPANEGLAAEVATLRKAAKHLAQMRLETARKSGEIPFYTDTEALAAFFAMVIQGMSVQASDGASKNELHKLVELAMQVWPKTGG